MQDTAMTDSPLRRPRDPVLAKFTLAALTVLTAHAYAAGDDDGLRWRLIGPFRAGWSTAASGAVDAPDTL